jgi:hypothetical protein
MKKSFSKINLDEDIDWNSLDMSQFSTKMGEQFGDQVFNNAFDIMKKNGADGAIFDDDYESKCFSELKKLDFKSEL